MNANGIRAAGSCKRLRNRRSFLLAGCQYDDLELRCVCEVGNLWDLESLTRGYSRFSCDVLRGAAEVNAD